MHQTDIANTLNASINDVCARALQCAKGRYGGKYVMDEIRAAEVSFDELGSGELPIYNGFGPIVYAIWHHSCHTAMAYRIFRSLLDMTQRLYEESQSVEEIQIVDVGSGTQAGLFGLTIAVAEAIANGENVPKLRFQSIDISEDMADFGFQLWRDFLDKTRKQTKLSSWFDSGIDRIHVLETQRSVKKLGLDGQRFNDRVTRWTLAMHAVYDETLEDLHSTFEHLNSSFMDDFRVLTAHHANRQKLRGLASSQYADIGNRYVFDPNRYHVAHRSKKRRRSSDTFRGFQMQIRHAGYLHGPQRECPKGAVIKMFRRVADQCGDAPIQGIEPSTKLSFLSQRRRVLPIKCTVDNQRLAIVHPPRGQTYRECLLCGAKYR